MTKRAVGAPAKKKAPARENTQPAPEAAVAPTPERPQSPWQRWSADPETAIAELCDFVVAGGHLADFCRSKDFAYTTALTWISAHPGRSELYARAREDRSDRLAEEIVAISDEVEVSARYQGEEVKLGIDSAAVARNRLRVDSRKWIAAKLKPRVYGDKLQVDATVDTKAMPDDALLAQLAKFGIKVSLSPAAEGEDEQPAPIDVPVAAAAPAPAPPADAAPKKPRWRAKA